MKALAQLPADDIERLRYNLISLEEIGRIFASEANFQKAAETALRGILGEKGTRRTKQLGGAMPDKKKIHKIIDLTIPMLPEMELAATKTAEGVAQFMGLSEDKLEEIKMALIEACINAFEHSQSKDQQISINFAIGDEDLTIQISDTGQGFDHEAARKEVVERRERGESKRGWGLTIMSELMDNVSIQSDENGTVITMIKQR